MSKSHDVRMLDKSYPGGLRIFECQVCHYAFAAEVDEHGIIQLNTRVPINQGDLQATHTLFQVPAEAPTLKMWAETEVTTS